MWKHVVVRGFQQEEVAFHPHKFNKINITKKVTWWNKGEMNFLHQLSNILISKKSNYFINFEQGNNLNRGGMG